MKKHEPKIPSDIEKVVSKYSIICNKVKIVAKLIVKTNPKIACFFALIIIE